MKMESLQRMVNELKSVREKREVEKTISMEISLQVEDYLELQADLKRIMNEVGFIASPVGMVTPHSHFVTIYLPTANVMVNIKYIN